jgi:hypothetical protein
MFGKKGNSFYKKLFSFLINLLNHLITKLLSTFTNQYLIIEYLTINMLKHYLVSFKLKKFNRGLIS